MADRRSKPFQFAIHPYRYTWDGETKVFVVETILETGVWQHPIGTQGTTMAEARSAMDSAVELTIKHWPPRKQ